MPLHEQEIPVLLDSRSSAIREAYRQPGRPATKSVSMAMSIRRTVGRMLIALGQMLAGPVPA